MTAIVSAVKGLVPTTLVGGIVALIILGTSALLYSITYNLFISPLKQFPGPLVCQISSLPYDIASARGVGHKYLRDLHEKYGPVVRVRPNELSYIKGEVWKDVWGFRSGHQEFYKADVITAANGVLGIISSKQHDHRRFRRLLSYAFSNQGLRDQEPRIQKHISNLMDSLAEESHREGGNQPVNIMQWFTWMSFDIISDLSLGASFDSIKNKTSHPWMQFTVKMLIPTVVLGILERWGLASLSMSLIPKSMSDDVVQSHEAVVSSVGKRMKQQESRGDFFDYLLKHDLVEEEEGNYKAQNNKESDSGGGITLSELHSTASDIGFAGSDTTSTLLSGIVFQLLRNPSAREKIVSEIREAFPSSSGSSSSITISSTAPSTLPYVDAVIQETLRTYHPTPVFSGRKVPSPGGDTVDGVWLPAGTRIIIPPYAAYMSDRNFHNPQKFAPERWFLPLSSRPEEFRGDNKDKVFQPFSSGPRNCIGMNLAQAETRLALVNLLWRFDVEKPEFPKGEEEKEEWDGWADRQRTWFLYDKGPLRVVLRERERETMVGEEKMERE